MTADLDNFIPSAGFLSNLWKTDWFWGTLSQSPSGHLYSCWFRADNNNEIFQVRSEFAKKLGLSMWLITVDSRFDEARNQHLFLLGTANPVKFTHSDIQKGDQT